MTAVQHSIGATASGVAGEAPALYDVSSISDSDLIHIVPIAIIAIGLLLALVLRSLVAPLYLIASVMFSYLAALGLASIIFIKLPASGGLTFLLPFLMFIFLLALGEDYNILVMTRIREEAHQRRLRDAVVTAVGRRARPSPRRDWFLRGRSWCSQSQRAANRAGARSATSASAWRSAS